MKKNLVKKAVLPAIVALICSVVALTSVSYAWFSMGDEASVSGMEMQVTAADGLQISGSGDVGSFKSNLVLNDLAITGAEENASPVSTDGTVSSGALSFYTAKIVDGQVADVAADTGNYITFDLYVQVAAGKKLQLTKDSIVKMIEGETKQTHLATRVAFINLGYASTAADAKAGTLSGEVSIKIWEPNSATRSQAYLNTLTDANDATKDGKQGYKGVVGANAGAPVYSTDDVDTFDFVGNDPVDLFDLGEGYNRIRVYIWLEGEDLDCLNEVSGGTFSIDLKFAQAAVAQADPEEE